MNCSTTRFPLISANPSPTAHRVDAGAAPAPGVAEPTPHGDLGGKAPRTPATDLHTLRHHLLLVAAWLLSTLMCGCSDEYWFGEGTEVVADVVTPDGVQSGVVSVDYVLSGGDSQTDVSVSYSTDGLVYRPATPADEQEATTDLSASRIGEFHTFLWDSGADLEGKRSSTVRVRVTPSDGASGRSEPFSVHNALWLTALKESRDELNLYSLDPHSGELTSMDTVSTPDESPCDVLFFEDRFLVAHRVSDSIAVFEVDEEEESLVEASSSSPSRPTGGRKDLETDGERVFMLNVDTDTITVFEFDPESKRLTAKATAGALGKVVPGADHFLVREDHIYVSREGRGDIVILDVSEEGALSSGRRPVSQGGLRSPGAMVAVEDHLYAFDAEWALVYGFTIEDDGGLTPLDEGPLEISLPGLDRITRDDERLYAARDGSEEVVLLDVSEDGEVEEKDCSFEHQRPLTSLVSSSGFVVTGSAESGTLDVLEAGDDCDVSDTSNALIARGSGAVHLSLSD